MKPPEGSAKPFSMQRVAIRAICLRHAPDVEALRKGHALPLDLLQQALANKVQLFYSRLWSSSISNATSGSHSVLCVADFYLHPDHDGQAACRCLAEVGETSAYRMPATQVNVVVQEKPWGTHYRLKAYVKESREQFDFVTDLTIRGKKALLTMNFRFARAPYAELG